MDIATWDIATWWLCFVGAVIVVGLALSFTQRATPRNPDGGSWGIGTRFFLVALRLAIGWHILFEGVAKLDSPSWSSEPYLRESVGPLAPAFRDLAGESVVDRLTVGPDKSFPAELDKDWRAYLEQFVRHYQLDAQQRQLAEDTLDKAKARTLRWLTEEPTSWTFKTPPPMPALSLTIPERLKMYEAATRKVREVEAKDRHLYGREAVFKELKEAKAEMEGQRKDLRAELAKQTAEMKKDLYETVIAEPRRLRYGFVAVASYSPFAGIAGGVAVVPSYQALQKQFLSPPEGLPDRMPDEPVQRPWTEQTVLQWSDAIVTWGLIAVGVALLLGVLTRTACLAGALFLLSFYLAMPPLPDWPESPRLEGHYLFVNKTLVEMLALLALATTRSGRWLGLDALLQFLFPAAWRAAPPAAAKTNPPSAFVTSGATDILPPTPSKEIPHGT
jgi:uncharacterized membrane protein YphA (DoxX/SURF4 family)